MKILLLPGDGIGTEVMKEAERVLEAVKQRFNCKFNIDTGIIGVKGIERFGDPLPPETRDKLSGADAILLGAVGGSDKYSNELIRPEHGLLSLRKEVGVFANIRPVKPFKALLSASNIKEDVIRGVDFVIVRELLGGLYFGKPKKLTDGSRGRRAVDTMSYTEKQIERLVRVGFELAITRRKIVHSVDKRNVLETSRLWYDIVEEVSCEYPGVAVNHMLVDNVAIQMILNPRQFDVIITENTFGDILSDEASALSGSMGMLPSASVESSFVAKRSRRNAKKGIYEPIHGAAPNLAGRNVANPIATILSMAMMLRISFGMDKAAGTVENAVAGVLKDDYRTKDISTAATNKLKVVTTSQMGCLVADRVKG